MGSEPIAFLSLLALVYLGHGVVADILSLQELCDADPSHYMCAGQVNCSDENYEFRFC